MTRLAGFFENAYPARLAMQLVRLFCMLLAVCFVATGARAGVTPFTDPGKIDFDTALSLVNPYGVWAKVGTKWAFTPFDHQAPYTRGRWLYSEYGWYWQGTSPVSWLTEHYGYWKRGDDQVWAWYPGPNWLPQTVEMRGSPDGLGWRSAEVDADGNFVEPPSVRYTKTDEWTFVTPDHFAGPINAQTVADPKAAEQMLEESNDSIHSYFTYREIDRPGPHPADFVNLGDGAMFAPMTAEDRAKAVHPNAPAGKPAATTNPSSPAAMKAEAAKLAASLTASETTPEIPQQPGGEDPNDDPRQVKYWVIMALPTPWTPKPIDAARDQLYIYRPDFYQDTDGISRRIAFWLDPNLRNSEAIHLRDVLSHPAAVAAVPGAAGPAVPATPARDFGSPFEETYHESASTKKTGAPSPVFAAGAPTNAAPVPAVTPSAGASPAPAVPAPLPDGRAPQ